MHTFHYFVFAMKHLSLSFLALLICTAGFSCQGSHKSAVGNAGSDKTCIEKAIAKDAALGKVRNHACEAISLSETIDDYVEGLKAIDFQHCPKDFALAFKAHWEAWEKMGTFVEKYPDMRGEMHDLFDEIEQGEDAGTFKPLLAAIWDTWGEIEESMKEE